MPKPYNILSLDLGKTFGWCLVSDAKVMYSGTVFLGDSDVPNALRFLRFINWLAKFKGVDEIIHERVDRFESGHAAKMYCGLLAHLEVFAAVNGKRLSNLTSKTIKKEFTGNGNADKSAMCAVAHKLGWKHGHPSTDIDHDEADAIAIAYAILKRRMTELTIT